MARAPDVIVDESSPDCPVINVPLRVGWLLRTCRLNSRVEPGMAGHRFAKQLGVGPAMVTKWEKGTDSIDAPGIAGYEHLVDLPAGSLRGLIETTRRSFRQPVSARVALAPVPEDLSGLTELVRPALAGSPSGIDWLHLADVLDDDGPLLLPEFVAEPAFDRLASELVRSVGGAQLTRYEALSRMRIGPYRDVVLRSLLRLALAPDTQASAALLDVAAQLPSAELFANMTRLLLDDREGVFFGASHALATMAARGGIPADRMRDAVPGLVNVYNTLADDPWRHSQLSAMLRNLPRGVLETARPTLARRLSPVPELHRPETRATVQDLLREVAADIRAELPSPDDHVLERLLLEAIADPRWTKAAAASRFLMALPYTDVVARHVGRLVSSSASPELRDAAANLVLRLGASPAGWRTVASWVDGDDLGRRRAALLSLGMWGDDLDTSMLEDLADEPWYTARLAVYAAGMTASPVLEKWENDPARSDNVRAGARWWLQHGPRVTDQA